MTYKRDPNADPHASALGSIKTAKKAAASKLNGLKGGGAGRPVTAPERHGWTKDAAGFHWTKGPYVLCTIASGDGSRRGYCLLKHCVTVGEYLTWEQVEKLTSQPQP